MITVNESEGQTHTDGSFPSMAMCDKKTSEEYADPACSYVSNVGH